MATYTIKAKMQVQQEWSLITLSAADSTRLASMKKSTERPYGPFF